jgi:hypothetical protein
MDKADARYRVLALVATTVILVVGNSGCQTAGSLSPCPPPEIIYRTVTVSEPYPTPPVLPKPTLPVFLLTECSTDEEVGKAYLQSVFILMQELTIRDLYLDVYRGKPKKEDGRKD